MLQILVDLLLCGSSLFLFSFKFKGKISRFMLNSFFLVWMLQIFVDLLLFGSGLYASNLPYCGIPQFPGKHKFFVIKMWVIEERVSRRWWEQSGMLRSWWIRMVAIAYQIAQQRLQNISHHSRVLYTCIRAQTDSRKVEVAS